MQITKEHYIDKGELLSFDYDTQIKACSIFAVLSGTESKITEGTKKLSVEFVLSLEQEYKKIVSKTRPATRG